MFELAACQPEREVVVIEAPEPGPAEAVLDVILSPLQGVREQLTATTGLGIDDPEAVQQVQETVPRESVAVESLGLTLSYLAAGEPDGRRVVFLHGSPGGATEWSGFLTELPAEQYRLAVDRPGFGESYPDAALPELAQQAAALRPVLDSPDGRKSVIVGYSYGGSVALRAALDMPEHVAGIVLVGAAVDPKQEEIHPLQSLAALEIFAQMLPAELDHANTELIALKEHLEVMAKELGDLEMPVVVVHGLRDTLVPVENVTFLQQQLPENGHGQVILIEEADHFLPWTHPDTISDAIACVIRQVEMQEAGQIP